nr:DUF924 family protein [Hahella ganghwensis]
MAPQAQAVLDFWFRELEPKDWWRKSAQLDSTIARRFGDVHQAACAGECEHWRSTPLGRLAEVIVLDQFSRNIYRDRPQAFAADSMALVLSQEAIAQGADAVLTPPQKAFLYLPFMHSESLQIHERALLLFNQPGLENNLEFEHRHKDIIERFGRYPHRNDILGRKSTAEEVAFLKEPGSSF